MSNINFLSEILETVGTIKGGWNINPLKWWLHARCDDPDNRCPCGGVSSTVAYTTNKDPDSGYARINFCPRYFGLDNLDQRVKENSKRELPISHRADLDNYIQNKGACYLSVSNPCRSKAKTIVQGALGSMSCSTLTGPLESYQDGISRILLPTILVQVTLYVTRYSMAQRGPKLLPDTNSAHPISSGETPIALPCTQWPNTYRRLLASILFSHWR